MPVRRPIGHDGPAGGLLLAGVVAALVVGACAPGPDVPRPPHPSLIPALEARAAEVDGAPEVLVRLGAAYREDGRLDEARATLEEAREIEPGRPETVFFLGVTYEDLGAWDEAEALYEEFLRVADAGPVRDTIEDRLPWVRRRALAAWARRTAEREAELADREPGPATVAVFPFRYQGEDPDLAPLASALSGLLVTDLAQVDRITVLERLRIDFLLDELRLAASERVDPATAARSGRLLGAGYVVQGRIGGGEDLLDLESAVLDVVDPPEGPPVPLRAEGALAAFIDAEKELALRIFEALGVELTAAERERVAERPTENVQALLAYGLGLDAEARGALDEAASHFGRAAELDAGFEAAVRSEERLRQTVQASSTTTDDLAGAGAGAFLAGSGLEDWRVRRLAFRDLEGLVPDVVVRDAASEIFLLEGLGSSEAVLEIEFELP